MNPKDLVGARKPGLSALPLPPVAEAGVVCQLGAQKYGRHNWRRDAVVSSAYFDGAMRHLVKWWEGEDIDPESGVSHLAHILAGIAILRDAQMRGQMIDDRPPGSPNPFEALQPAVDAILRQFPEAPAPVVAETMKESAP